LQQKLGPLLLANAKVWTPVNVVTYSLPPEWRLLFVSAMELLWQSVNSRITSADISSIPEENGEATETTVSS